MSETKASYRVRHYEPSPYADVRLPDGSLAFRYDAQRRIVEIQIRGHRHYVDLAQLDREAIDKRAEIQ